MSFRRSKNVIIIIYNLYDLVCWKIFYFWVKSILGNYETTLHSYFLPGDIDWYGYRWTDVHCFSIVDCRWHYSIGDVTFIMDQKWFIAFHAVWIILIFLSRYLKCWFFYRPGIKDGLKSKSTVKSVLKMMP